MGAIITLLGKDLRKLRRSPVLAVSLVLYPLVIAILVGLLVQYVGERPRVAYVDLDGLPAVLVVGDQRLDIADRFAKAAEVDLAPMSESQATRELETGKALATIVVPEGFARTLRGLRASPRLELRVAEGGLGDRVVEKIRSFVYRLNLDLQRAYIEANLGYVDLLVQGGSGTIGKTKLTLIGLTRAEAELRALSRSGDAKIAARAAELRVFVSQLRGAVGQVGDFLNATANPIELVETRSSGRSWIFGVQAQAYALGLALAFIATLLGAAVMAAERDENVLGRLLRGLASPWQLVLEKVLLVALAATVIGMVVALAIGAIVEITGAAGGEPWERLPLLACCLFFTGAAFGSLGTLVAALARDASSAILVAFLAAVPAVLLGVLPNGSIPAAERVGDLLPFGHATRSFAAALYDARPFGAVGRELVWLLALLAVYTALARAFTRRMLV